MIIAGILPFNYQQIFCRSTQYEWYEANSLDKLQLIGSLAYLAFKGTRFAR